MSIKILDSVLASRIAAGEVIQRPASAVRETLDNAIDSGADHITLSIKDGGISSIRIADNGCGMSKEDLELCFESHATSKISTNEDLYNITTLGFRGEALYSIAACSRLSIESGQWKTEVDNSVKLGLSPSPVSQGTVVTVLDLFDKIPARKEFLKRPAAEAAACKAVLVEKALAFPSVRFTFINDDRQVLDLFAADAKKRVLDTLAADRSFDQTSAVEYKAQGESYSLYGVSGSRDVYKADRSAIKV
ncbi:MAG: DNA mismatch repair endonuclease MutL, partial [Sphaerochaetaceae bacterium]|nr:DNA mismatch repair endonuclease MutL [Sphaerochaetaceae bacterium]